MIANIKKVLKAGRWRISAGMGWLAPALCLAAVIALTGCSRYNITMYNGNTVTAKGKPKVDDKNHTVTYKDIDGETVIIPSMRVRQIEPQW